jgi:intracellular septation protein
MNQFLELIPIVLFFIVYQLDGETVEILQMSYQFDGIYSATLVLIIATAIQLILTRLISGHLEKRLLILFGVVILFGGATLAFRNEAFIQWKPTIFNWGLAIVFIGSQLISGKTIMERTLNNQMSLPADIWTKLNLLWIGNFILVGALNLVVAYGFSLDFWVSYKLYSSIGFTLVLVALTVVLISPHIREEDLSRETEKK